MNNAVPKKSWTDKFIDTIERICDKLPQPAIIFFWLFIIVAIVGAVFTKLGITAINPAISDPAKALVRSKNLFSAEGIQWLLDNLVKNFTGYAPLGNVVIISMAIGLCEESGFLLALLKRGMRNVPPMMVPFAVAFLGTLGNLAADTAAIIIPPMAAIAYIGVGKHPVVGMINAYAAVQAGFTANIMISATDSLLSSLTNLAIKGFLPDSTLAVDVTCNWFFLVVSVALCTLVIGGVSEWMIEPRFGKYIPIDGATVESDIDDIPAEQRKGLRVAGFAILAYFAVLLAGFYWGSLAKITETGERLFVGSPLLKGIIPIMFGFFTISGLAFGYGSGSIKNTTDINRCMVKQASILGSYIVFCFFAGQFNMLFNWTKLGTMMAIGGVNILKGLGFTGIPMCVAFIVLSGIVNIFVSSGSAKWAVFAPIFVPMFMLLGYHPGFAQLLYRLGDSPSNCFTPILPYVWMILSIAQVKYMKDCKIGTLIANLMPIGIIMQLAWIIFFIIWAYAGLPIGPGVYAELPAGIL